MYRYDGAAGGVCDEVGMAWAEVVTARRSWMVAVVCDVHLVMN